METLTMVLNPATGTSLPIPLFIISGVVLVGIIVWAVVSKKLKDKKNSAKRRRRK